MTSVGCGASVVSGAAGAQAARTMATITNKLIVIQNFFDILFSSLREYGIRLCKGQRLLILVGNLNYVRNT
jgi:hypothetical protein